MQMSAIARGPHQVVGSIDISKGREAFPIPCVNEVDDTPLPDQFTVLQFTKKPHLIDVALSHLLVSVQVDTFHSIFT
ncbi:unnamed protein product [Leptidea sinapis]|uniref:Uncharacterized protein n=1 Tax=Leptidea sinapis TaxID=189913 RepID=A0A5E4QX49_9NEOP|nr:unnamed protein product [Leptidea sinapis]